ncbi:ankyrin repeat domain-containing protein [Leptospira mayottensis]|uniref:Ankyrin repeat protein n=2 Tax=Leptospira mayottensis TaxID=1137606 RepID=A0AA87MMN0_9LEPT|nr:ankyrin repeat domain-containing protein [Leptospira mayottensis]AXR60604.1 ankyrin repeat domain-containing protein [Leptospira mayottensis]AXR64415.1 ankyrin repeat domain-containing protein [Leptospira mayottensis]AXR68135.1 ankyrin repeat domain-containing protein [Leptospira mayottensis]AZQ02964.1 ankyrin repeat domain-containing protein [Leptospira mayottensis 200901116]EKR98496.1 ankyrin repeat protein [Leptospira mayottensis 200901122]
MKEEKKSQIENLSVKTGLAPFWKRFLFFRAVQNGNVERVRSYLQDRLNLNRSHGMTPLSLAVRYDQLEIVRILIEYLADPNLPDEKTGLTPLIHSILEDCSSAMISTLIEGGADLDQRDKKGMGPLHYCVNEGKLESLRFLLEKGADPNVRDLDGVTCINLAKSSHGMSEFVELLLKYGADPTIKDKHGKTYLM